MLVYQRVTKYMLVSEMRSIVSTKKIHLGYLFQLLSILGVNHFYYNMGPPSHRWIISYKESHQLVHTSSIYHEP